MANFDFTPTPVPLNPLFTGLGIDEGINKVRAGELSNQSAQQDLVDRATIRAQAEGLASGDRSAIARLATLPKAGGTLSVHGMSEYDTAAREIQNQNALLGLAGGLAARDPATMARAALLGKSGVAAVNALGTMDHNAATTALARLKADREQVFWGDEDGAGPGIPQGLATPLGGAESGNDDTRVNGDGYSGRFQFGAARLASPALGFYKPAPGENLKTNEWRGTFDIPGFPEIKTHEDFLRSPRAKEAQRAVFGVHVRDIDQTIANTPGAEGLDVNGLRAVAHLGGSAGMQEFVRTGGKYDPQDRNGTHLSDYYRRFASGGTPALVRAFGAPQEGGGAPAAPAAGGAPGGMATPVAASGGDAGMATPAAGADSAPAGPGSTWAAVDGNAVSRGFAPQSVPPGTQFATKGGEFVKGAKEGEVLARVPNGRGGFRRMSLPAPGSTPTVQTHMSPDGTRVMQTDNTGRYREVAAQGEDILRNGDDTSLDYAREYARRVAAGTKIVNGETVLPDMRMYRPPRAALPGDAAGGAPADGAPARPLGAPNMPPRRLPPELQKMDDADVEALQSTSEAVRKVSKFGGLMDDGKLVIGPGQNLASRGLNAMNRSSENSANFAAFEREMNDFVNKSLLLNKGTQTEGDAERARKSLMSNLSNQTTVREALADLEQANRKATSERLMKMNWRRQQNGMPPVAADQFVAPEPPRPSRAASEQPQPGSVSTRGHGSAQPAPAAPAAPPATPTPAAAPAAPAAAPAASQPARTSPYKDGDKAFNKATGETLVFKNGAWVKQ